MSTGTVTGARGSRSCQEVGGLRARRVRHGTIGLVDVSSLSTSLTNVSSARVQLEASTAVLGRALDAMTQQSSALLGALSVDEPAGLTFSPAGLSPGRSSRFVADL